MKIETGAALICFCVFFYVLTIFSCASFGKPSSLTNCQKECLENYRVCHFELKKEAPECGILLDSCTETC